MPAALDDAPKFSEYAHPEKLVSTDWLAEHLDDPDLVIVESDEDVLLYDTGHIPGPSRSTGTPTCKTNSSATTSTPRSSPRCCSEQGIARDTTVVFYGDNFNWWAAYALWVFRLFGHEDIRLLNGGRQKWVEEDRPLTTDVAARARHRLPGPRSATTRRSGPSATTCSPTPSRADRWSTCGHPRSTGASCSTCPTTRRRGRCAAATSRGRAASRGSGPPTTTAPSSRRRAAAIYEDERARCRATT